jgi:hypothetical protein
LPTIGDEVRFIHSLHHPRARMERSPNTDSINKTVEALRRLENGDRGCPRYERIIVSISDVVDVIRFNHLE